METNLLELQLTSTALEMVSVTVMVPVSATVDSVMLTVDVKLVKDPHSPALDVVLANVMVHVLANLDSPTLTQESQSVIVPPLAQPPTTKFALDTEPANVVPANVNQSGLLSLIAHARMDVTRPVERTKFATAKENANVFLASMVKTAMLNLLVMLPPIVLNVLKLKTALGVLKKAFVKTSMKLNSALMIYC